MVDRGNAWPARIEQEESLERRIVDRNGGGRRNNGDCNWFGGVGPARPIHGNFEFCALQAVAFVTRFKLDVCGGRKLDGVSEAPARSNDGCSL